MCRPARVLHERRTAGRQVALRAIAEPPRPSGHVRMFCDTEFGFGAMDEIAVFSRRSRYAHGVHCFPTVFTQQRLRSVDCQLEALGRSRGEIDVLDELLIL